MSTPLSAPSAAPAACACASDIAVARTPATSDCARSAPASRSSSISSAVLSTCSRTGLPPSMSATISSIDGGVVSRAVPSAKKGRVSAWRMVSALKITSGRS